MINPVWIAGPPQTAPGANSVLIALTPTNGRLGVVYGFRINSQEVNAAGKVWRLGIFASATFVPLLEVDVLNPIIDSNIPLLTILGIGANQNILQFVVQNLLAGTAATRHQAWIKYAEFDQVDLPGLILGSPVK